MTDPGGRRVVISETPGRGWGLGPAEAGTRRGRSRRPTAAIASATAGLVCLAGLLLNEARPADRPINVVATASSNSVYVHPLWDFRFFEENIVRHGDAAAPRDDAATIRFLEENVQPAAASGR